MPFDPQRPHDDLPALPPAADIESRPLLKACIEARAALAELKSVGAAIPNQAVLINTIPLLEAQASSEIENIVTTSDALFRFAQDEQAADPATKEALNYRAALREGFESLAERPLGTGTAVRVCSRLKNRDMDVRRVPGTALKNAALAAFGTSVVFESYGSAEGQGPYPGGQLRRLDLERRVPTKTCRRPFATPIQRQYASSSR